MSSRFKVQRSKLYPFSFLLFSFLLSPFLHFPFSLLAQQAVIDIDESAQNRIMATPVQNCDFHAGLNQNNISIIENNKQIPALGLYQNQWDTLFIRSEKIEIPFFDDQIKIILIQEGNTPFAFPVSGVVSTGFVKNRGKQHAGIDFTVKKREPIVACFDGVVRIGKKFEEYGNTVILRHYNGLETVYARLDNVNVVAGQKVKAGELVGYIGDINDVLHLETRFLNEIFNPEKMINFSERRLYSNILTLTPNDFAFVPAVVKHGEKEMGEKEMGVTKPSLMPVYHTVQKGDTIYKICLKYNISEQQLRTLNNIKGDKIDIGQKLRIQ